MYLVFVKHYLTPAGISFFNHTWFPSVKAAISMQPGFVEINAQQDESNLECMHIKLRFRDQATLQAWAKTKLHDDLVDNLDDYRSRSWEVATHQTDEDDAEMDALNLTWQDVIPRKIAYL